MEPSTQALAGSVADWEAGLLVAAANGSTVDGIFVWLWTNRKTKQLFEAASNLPRRQQQKIIGQVEDFLVARGTTNGANGHS